MLRHAPGFLIFFSEGNLLEGWEQKILGGHVKEKMADKLQKSAHLRTPKDEV